ncbi:MAG: hypothetical protein HKN47_23745, partial [Pirellulaceae bacterium]|nr:hypothetical protein [Pirellulaceae bacterium]
VKLKSGKNLFAIRFDSENHRHGGLDCFVFSSDPFLPQGNRQPGQKTGLADEGTWAFEPDRDSFAKDALLDLTYLNDRPAGRHGYVRRSDDGDDFVDGRGEPIRFWAINTSVQMQGDLYRLKEHARWMAKRGVNMVRHHGHLAPGAGSKITDVNQKDIDAAWRLVAAMKEQGIYVTLSPYWAVSVKPQPGWGLKDAGGDNLTGLLFFDRDLQAAYKTWLQKLLVPKNPHTGIPLAKDPTLAIFQIQNEDSLLFWTEQAIQGEQRLELGSQFGDWLTDKYGGIHQAAQDWGGPAKAKGDDFASGIVVPHPIYQMTQQANGAMANRLNDQTAFYTELMRSFNAEIARFLKEDLGYNGLVNPGNWRTADQAKLLDAERYSYAVNDVIGLNRYFNGGSHTNPTDKRRSGYLVSQGDLFKSQSALKMPWAFPLAVRQVSGHPMIISESAWVPPLRYQSEGPFLVAAYSALTGVDIFYWFATDDIGFGPPMGKWQLSTPAQLGMFPAAAFMFRKGLIQKAAPVVLERRTLDEIWSRKPPLLPEEAGFDPNRDRGMPASGTETAARGNITPLAYLAGPVTVDFEPGPDAIENLQQSIDPPSKTIKSATGQLTWNYGDGYCKLDSPQAQGACGHLARIGTIKLSSIALRCRNDYASVLAVALDNQPLGQSQNVLLQIGTIARPYGWSTADEPNGQKRITSLGSSPWNIQNTDVEAIVANTGLTKAILLDANGVSMGELPTIDYANGLRLELPSNAMYVLLQ